MRTKGKANPRTHAPSRTALGGGLELLDAACQPLLGVVGLDTQPRELRAQADRLGLLRRPLGGKLLLQAGGAVLKLAFPPFQRCQLLSRDARRVRVQ